MELRTLIVEALAPMFDVTVRFEDETLSTGKEFTRIYINRRGTVLQFLAPYPSVDENYNKEFLRNILKEI